VLIVAVDVDDLVDRDDGDGDLDETSLGSTVLKSYTYLSPRMYINSPTILDFLLDCKRLSIDHMTIFAIANNKHAIAPPSITHFVVPQRINWGTNSCNWWPMMKETIKATEDPRNTNVPIIEKK
jgi:hypothetical protein